MSNKVLSKNLIYAIKIDTTYYPIFCAKTSELSTDQEEIETTSVNSGRAREYIPGMSASTLACTGITTLDNSGGQISPFYLNQAGNRQTIWEIRAVATDDDGNILVLMFDAFITNVTVSKQVGSYSQSSASFRISGEVAYSNAIPTPTDPVCDIADPLYKTLAEAATSVTDALLAATGVEIIGVWRSTDAYTEVVGTPSSGQFAFDGTTGTISFDPTNPGAPGGEPVHVVYKVTA
jgi:hypothetical protein